MNRYLNHFKRLVSSLNNFEKISYSQLGEDIIINHIFCLRGISKPTYIDIGANDPFFLNNTALMYSKGCRGINIDANELLINRFKQKRPADINLNIGIGAESSMLNFYIMEDNTLSTFDKNEFDKMILDDQKLKELKEIKLVTISSIIEQYCSGIFPDFLSIDVEGMDFEILKTIDFKKYWPKVICVEATENSPIGLGKKRTDMINFLIQEGYYEYANTNLNSILVKNAFWFT